MQLALLGFDPDSLALSRAIQERSDAALRWIVGAASSEFGELAPQAERLADWESLLAPGRCAGVIFAAPTSGLDDPLRQEQLRRLAQAAVPMLIVHPGVESIVGFEIEMIRGDVQGVIDPYFPGDRHPALARIGELLAEDGPLGGLEQVVCSRRLKDRSRDAVLAALARDVELLRRILGPINKISALAANDEANQSQQTFANLAVQMSGGGAAVARWSAGPPGNEPGVELTLVGPRGEATLAMPSDERRWRWKSGASAMTYESWNGPREALDAFLRHIAEPTSETTFDWSNACRACELAEAAARSAQRGRTIELHLETHSEEETFKGLMAAGGCLLVIVALFGLFIASMIGGFQLPTASERGAATTDENAASGWYWWLRIWPAYPFLIFLGLQFFRLVFRKPSQN